VAALAEAVAARADGAVDGDRFALRLGALLHNVGHLEVPPAVLNRPGKLDADEWALVRRHPEAGAALVAGCGLPAEVAAVVAAHHERWDGAGYPLGLAGEAIPLAARVVAVADVYDALTTPRPYKRALAHDDALAIMRRDVGRAVRSRRCSRGSSRRRPTGPRDGRARTPRPAWPPRPRPTAPRPTTTATPRPAPRPTT
jgi:HD-GYP domain-containing protein (c-di-GMP phosphodiesterase class II)